MLIVTPELVGRSPFARMLRDGSLAPFAPGAALPRDIPDSPALRAHHAAGRVPAHTVLTGTAALWVHGIVPTAPSTWTVTGTRGLHRTVDPLLDFHSGATASLAERRGALALAPVARACLDALRWQDLADALPATMAAIRVGAVTVLDLRAALGADSPRGNGIARVRSALLAVMAATAPRA